MLSVLSPFDTKPIAKYFLRHEVIAGKIGTLWSPAMLREIFLPHMRRFADAVRDAGVPWIFLFQG